MTASVGNAAPRGADSLLQTGAAKVPAGNFRRHETRTDDANSQSEDTPPQTSTASEVDASQPQVDGVRKVSKGKSGDDNSNGDEGSFEDAFDSMGQDASKDVTPTLSMATGLPSQLLLAQVSAGNVPVNNTDVTQTSPQASTMTSPGVLLKQKSILASMDTKDRLFANSGEVKTDDNVAKILPEQSETIATDSVPITIDRTETHWNFNSDAVASIASKVSALQTASPLSQPIQKQGVASKNVSQEQALEPKKLDGAAQEIAPQAVVMPDADQSADAGMSNGGSGAQSGSQLPNQIASLTATEERTNTKADAPSSIDQLMSANLNVQQNAQSVTGQVRDGIVNSLAANAPDGSGNATQIQTSGRPAATPVLRSLDLTLSPPDLGDVKLRMSLKSNSLSIEAEASKASTAKLLSDDRANLERGLRDAGYDVSSMKITDASASNSSNTNGWQTGGQQPRDGEQARSAFGGRQDSEMQRREGSMSDQSQRRQRQDNPQQASEPANGRPASGVYI